MSVVKICSYIVLLTCWFMFAGCTTGGSLYYNNSVSADFAQETLAVEPGKNLTPVIFIHGLMGSNLWDKSQPQPQQLWGSFSYWSMCSDDFAQKLALPILPGKKAGNTVAGDILGRSKISFMGISGGMDHYANVLAMLEAIGYRCDNNTLFVMRMTGAKVLMKMPLLWLFLFRKNVLCWNRSTGRRGEWQKQSALT